MEYTTRHSLYQLRDATCLLQSLIAPEHICAVDSTLMLTAALSVALRAMHMVGCSLVAQLQVQQRLATPSGMAQFPRIKICTACCSKATDATESLTGVGLSLLPLHAVQHVAALEAPKPHVTVDPANVVATRAYCCAVYHTHHHAAVCHVLAAVTCIADFWG